MLALLVAASLLARERLAAAAASGDPRIRAAGAPPAFLRGQGASASQEMAPHVHPVLHPLTHSL
jgi:hypothetical protein